MKTEENGLVIGVIDLVAVEDSNGRKSGRAMIETAETED
jgi:hypothetical protein